MSSGSEWGEVILDGMAFPASIQWQNLATFQGKVTFGEFTDDSNPLLSTWSITDLSGGHGVADLREGTDSNRCRWATLQTRFPKQFALPRAAIAYTGPSGAVDSSGARPLGDLYESGTYRFYAAFGDKLSKWDETGLAFGASLATLVGTPVSKATEFKGSGTRKLFIPCGTSGYSTWDGSAAADDATKLAVSFAVWAERLVMLDTDGQLWYTTDGAAWTSYGSTGKLDASYIPRSLRVFFDRSENPALFVVTDRDVWAFDPGGPTLHLTQLHYPPHPYSGLATDIWRGDLYTTHGMGVHRYTGDSISGMGLDRDDGLPNEWRGRIVDLEAEYNGLYAYVLGGESGSNTNAHVQVFTGFGWHTEWVASAANPPVATATSKSTWIKVSIAQGAYSLWIGHDGSLKRIKLPVDFANPRQLDAGGNGQFVAGFGDYEIQTGRFDAGMAGYRKIAASVQYKVKQGTGDTGGDGTPNWAGTIYYRIDGEDDWTTLITFSTWDRENAVMGTSLGGGHWSGVPFTDIELKAVLSSNGGSGSRTTTPILEAFVLSFVRLMPSSFAWTVQIDLSAPHKGNSPATMAAKLDELIASEEFFEMTHRDVTYGVRMSQLAGGDNTGLDTRGTRTVSVVEIKIPGTLVGQAA